jgi:hypothetical protein
VKNCQKVVEEVEKLIDDHSSLKYNGRGKLRRVWDTYRVGSADLDTLRGRLAFYAATIDILLHSLEGPALARIEAKLNLFIHAMSRTMWVKTVEE